MNASYASRNFHLMDGMHARPVNAYTLFDTLQRPNMRKRFPNMSENEISKRLSE